jgi:hypothetical protein
MYRILDTYGTSQVAWTWREALAWLAACSPEARIVNRITGRTIAARSLA